MAQIPKSLNAIADNIISGLNEPFDDVLKQRVKFTVKLYRALFLRRDAEKNGLNRHTQQSFTMELELVDFADDPGVVVGCKVLRTKDKVPVPVRHKTDVPFKYVGNLVGGLGFAYTEQEELRFTKSNTFTCNVPRYTWRNGYLYVYGVNRMKWLQVQGSFENPEEAFELQVASGQCASDDDVFPIPMDILAEITDGMIRGQLPIRATLTNDLETKIDANLEPDV